MAPALLSVKAGITNLGRMLAMGASMVQSLMSAFGEEVGSLVISACL